MPFDVDRVPGLSSILASENLNRLVNYASMEILGMRGVLLAFCLNGADLFYFRV